MNTLKIVYDFLPKKFRLRLYIYYITVLLTNFLDVIGIGLFFPVLNFLINKKINVPFIDNLISKFNLSNNEIITWILSIILVVFLLKNLLIIFINIFQTRFSSELGYDLSRDLFNKYLSLPIRFHTSNNSSKLLRNTTDEIFNFLKFVLGSILLIFSDITLLCIFTLVLIFISPIKTIFILALFSAIALLIYYLSKDKIKSYGNKRLEISENLLRFLREGFSSIREIKIYNLKNFFITRYRDEGQKTVLLSIFINLTASLPKIIFEFFAVTLFVLLVLYISKTQQDFNQIVPTLGLLVLLIYRITPSVIRILQNFQRIKHYMPSFYNIYSAFQNNNDQIESDIDDIDKNFKFESIELSNVFFHYNQNEKILDNINLKIEKKSRILIQGKSGCGKSTFLDILCGLLLPTQGEIFINQKKAKETEKRNLLSKISYVSQAPFLLDSDLASNIALGMGKNQDLEKIIKILKMVELDNFIENLSSKSLYRLGEGGSLISGGQKQRVAIARALFFEPQILILDEATNSIDYETEIKILKNIIDEYPNLTIIKVSHSTHNYENMFQKYELKQKKLFF